MSAYGTPGETGVLVLSRPPGNSDISKDDVILSLNGNRIATVADLLRATKSLKPGAELKVGILRMQHESTVVLRTE
jgi:S1-C subfamily serine protease